jgi:hypothetical protein
VTVRGLSLDRVKVVRAVDSIHFHLVFADLVIYQTAHPKSIP